MAAGFLVILLAFFGVVGLVIADRRGLTQKEGFGYGALLGPIGWCLLAIKEPAAGGRTTDGSNATNGSNASLQEQYPDGRSGTSHRDRPQRKCPHCAEYILMEANVCKHCGLDVPEPQPEDELRACESCYRLIRLGSEECPYCSTPRPFW